METLRKLVLLTCLILPCYLSAAEAVNINTADKTVLMEMIKGIGEKKAEAIVAFREKNGPFKSVDDLAQVRGIGAATVEKNRENLTTGN